MPRVIRPFATLLLLVLPTASAGRDIHVNNVSGDDGATGHHAETMPDRTGPVRTIARALRLAYGSDRVVVANTGQVYRESITLFGSRHSGTPAEPFVIDGNGSILDGSAPVPPEAWSHYRDSTYRFRPLSADYQQLFYAGRPLLRAFASRYADVPPRLEPMRWCLHEGYVYFCAEPARRPQDYGLGFAEKRVGITLFHVEHVQIANLVVQGFQLDGINAFNSARRVSLLAVTCRGNGRSGITVGGASIVQINNCLLGDNGAAQLLTEPWSQTRVVQSRLLSNTAPAWVDQGGRVWIDGNPVQGGLDEWAPGADKQPAPASPAVTALRPEPKAADKR